jgi:YceI-like domain
MTLPAAREQETPQQPGDIIVGAPAASKVSMPPSDPTQMVNHQLVPAAGTYQIDPAHTFVDFTAQHLVVGHVRGRFTQLAGQPPGSPGCNALFRRRGHPHQHSSALNGWE